MDIFPLDVFSIYLPFHFFFLLRAGVCWERRMRKNVNETEATGDLRLLVPHVFPLKDEEEGLGDPVFAYMGGVGSPEAEYCKHAIGGWRSASWTPLAQPGMVTEKQCF